MSVMLHAEGGQCSSLSKCMHGRSLAVCYDRALKVPSWEGHQWYNVHTEFHESGSVNIKQK